MTAPLGHTLHDARHTDWDAARPAAISLAPGEMIGLACRDASDGQIQPDAGDNAAAGLDPARVNPVTGPIEIAGAEPGDAVLVHVEALEPADHGWTANIPGFGLLSDDFPDPAVRTWTIDRERGRAELQGGLAWAPLRPFLGTIGLPPARGGPHPIIPPHRCGGNMDLRDVTEGARLILPAEVAGGLLSAGDGHAAQGDGEVCGTAIETGMEARLRISLLKGDAPPAPMVEAVGERRPSEEEPRLVTTGIGPDLATACRDAVRAMVDQLAARRGLAPIDAYLLCSVLGDLRIGQLVDAPNWTAAFQFPLSRLD